MLRVLWLWYQPFVNEFRSRLNLGSWQFRDFSDQIHATPLLGMYSPSIIPKPADWPDQMQITGYQFLAEKSTWQPSAELEEFINSGPPPVYIGFGSMAGQDPEALAAMSIAALRKAGQRGILLSGWGGLRAHQQPGEIFILDSAPHDFLFPRMAAVVHHGGAGTTASGLRAGVPTVILPFIMDQFFWGSRISALGLGPEPIPQKKLTTDRLSQAIHQAVTDKDMIDRARSCGESIQAEDGTTAAVDTIQLLLDRSSEN